MNTHTKKDDFLFKRDGTCQAERLPKSLVNNSALIDEKTVDEHIVFLYLYSDLIKYYGPENIAFTHNGWRSFLENDDTVILSLILHTEITQLKSRIYDEFQTIKNKAIIGGKEKHIKQLLQVLQELMLLTNYWYKNLSAKNSIKLKLETLVSYELNERISLLYSLLQQWERQTESETPGDFCTFAATFCEENSLWELTTGTRPENFTEEALVQHIIATLGELFDLIFGALLGLQKLAKKKFPAILQSQQHPPQTALLIAFLRLLQYASERINQIPQRHLDFYYREVLKFNQQPAKTDNAIVSFQLQDGIKHHLLPEGTMLSAGKDEEGQEILFKTKRGINISQAAISTIHEIRHSIEEQAPESEAPIGTFNTARYTIAELNEKGTHSLFSQQATANQPATHVPLIGFVLTSPILHLKEGHREINLKFKFTKDSFGKFLENLEKGKKKEISTPEEVAFLFKRAIDVHLTSEKQWVKLSPIHVGASISKKEPDCLAIILSLPPDIQPVVGFAQEAKAETYGIEAPAIRIGINDTAHFSSIYLLAPLLLHKVTIEVAVKDYRGLVLQNDLGLVDSSHPFQPFGPLPQLHGNFYLGSDEVFAKNLSSLSINIEWDGLPTIDDGFKGYYKEYAQKITNEDFKAKISYLNHRQWYPFDDNNRQHVCEHGSESCSAKARRCGWRV